MNNTFNLVVRSYPPDRFPDKATAITKAAEKFVLDDFKYTNLRKSRPSSNKLSKLCVEYINMAMSHIIGLKFSATKISINLEDLSDDLRLGIVQPSIYTVEFTISNDNKNYKLQAFNDGILYLDLDIRKGIRFYTTEIKESLVNCLSHLNGILERGCMHACAELHDSGLWFTERDLAEAIESWLWSTNPDDEKVHEGIVSAIALRILQTEVNTEYSMECRLEKMGGDDEAIPAFNPSIITDGKLGSVFMPQKTSKGWGISVVTTEDNLPNEHLAEINQMTIGINKLITSIKGTKVR